MNIRCITGQSPRQPQRRGLRAFSLIECVVAVSVIMIAFVTIFGSITFGFTVTQLSRENLRATQILIDKMEGVRLYSWDQITNTTFLKSTFTNYFFETNNIGQVTATGNGVLYTGLVSVAQSPFSTSYSNNMVQVTVTVGWMSSGKNILRTRTMKTLVGQFGLQNYVYYD